MSETIKNLDFGDLCLEEDLDDGEEGEDRNEELRSEKHRADIVKKSDQNMSKGEMMQIIESQRREIKYLNEKLRRSEEEKSTIIENFKLSTSVLIERIKDLEANQTLGFERPQTAQVMSNIRKLLSLVLKIFRIELEQKNWRPWDPAKGPVNTRR